LIISISPLMRAEGSLWLIYRMQGWWKIIGLHPS
jgi:hypothetical protein